MPTLHLQAFRSERSRAVAGTFALLMRTLSACTTSLPTRGQVVMRDVTFPLRDLRLAAGLRVVMEEDHAFTRLDHTAYQTLVPREAVPELLKLEARRLAAPLEGITEEVFAVEREVVRNELRQGNETGFVGQVFHWMQVAAFLDGHPYAQPVISSHDSLSSLTLADAQRFARKHYQPRNVTLVITGDVDLHGMEALLRASLPEAWHGDGPPLAVSPRLPQSAPEPPLAPAWALISARHIAMNCVAAPCELRVPQLQGRRAYGHVRSPEESASSQS